MFITFEGPEGSGKTTQIAWLADLLQGKGLDVLATREPGGTAIGDRIRAILLDPDCTEMRAETEALLFSAARAQIVAQIIRPHLARGGVVLCDRYADSTLAYQGHGHGLDLALLRRVTALATGNLIPDLTVYLDIEVEAGLQRKRQAAHADLAQWNRMERKVLDFHRRVREGYLMMAAAEPQRWLLLDASQEAEQVQRALAGRVIALVGLEV